MKRKTSCSLLIIGSLLFWEACKEKTVPEPIISQQAIPDTPVIPPTPFQVSYHRSSSHFLDSLASDIDVNTVLALNRIDKKNLHRYDSILVPDSLSNDFQLYSPFPKRISYPDSQAKLILVSLRLQAFAAYDSGSQVRWGPVNTGKSSTPTPSGFFHTNWKSKRTVSTENPKWILNWYFNIDNLRGVSFHEYDLPGFPVSHACIRMLEADAKWLYGWAAQWKLSDGGSIAEQGTPVMIYGKYLFKDKQPWSKPEIYLKSIDIDRKELDSLLRNY